MRKAFRRPASEYWPNEGLSHIPYRLYNDEEIHRLEQEKLFRGPAWNFVAMHRLSSGPPAKCVFERPR